MKGLRTMALLGLLGALLGGSARGQSFPVYWDSGQGSYRWSQNLIDFATETWVLLQGYINATQATNIVAEAIADIDVSSARESLWYIDNAGVVTVKSQGIDYGDHWERISGDWAYIQPSARDTMDILWRRTNDVLVLNPME